MTNRPTAWTTPGGNRSLRIGEPAANERDEGPPADGNQPPDSQGDTRTGDRLDRVEALVGELLAAVRGNLFPEVGVGKGSQSIGTDFDFDARKHPLGSRTSWGRDDDGDPRTERPYNVRTGTPTDQSRDPHTLDLQDRVYDCGRC